MAGVSDASTASAVVAGGSDRLKEQATLDDRPS